MMGLCTLQAVPLCGGRKAVQDVAQIFEVLLVPPAAPAPVPQGKEQKGGRAQSSRPATAPAPRSGSSNEKAFPLDQLQSAALSHSVIPTLLEVLWEPAVSMSNYHPRPSPGVCLSHNVIHPHNCHGAGLSR